LIVPDADKAGRKGAEQTKDRLNKLGIESKIVDLFPERNDGYDLADFVRDKKTANVVEPAKVDKKDIIKQMSDKNSVLLKLVDRLDLKIA